MKIIGKIKGLAKVNFEREPQCRLINQYYYNQDNCNELIDGKYIPVEHENREKLVVAHNNISQNFILEVEADLTDEGRLINFKIVKDKK